jgi:hypothetical protein
LLFAWQVEVVDAGTRLRDCLPVGVGGVGDLGEGFPDALQSFQAVLAWVSSSRRACSISRAVAGSNPAWRAAWYSAAIVCCISETSCAASAIRAASVSAPMSTLAPLPASPARRRPSLGAVWRAVVRAAWIWDQTASSSVWTRMDRQPQRSGLSAGVCSRCRHT